jgi:CLIP-associating protein 1/2
MRFLTLVLKGLAHENTVVRSATSMVVVSAQMVLNDQAHLFTLLDGLSEEKKNFLTYLFDKNRIQPSDGNKPLNELHPAFQKMVLEVNRLDGRVNPR